MDGPFFVTCDDCGGEGGFYVPDPPPFSRWADPTPGERFVECPACRGSGWTASDAPEPARDHEDIFECP